MTGIDLLEIEPQASQKQLASVTVEVARKKELMGWIVHSLVCLLIAIAVSELCCRFVAFVGKPALTSNPQYHLKYLVAKTVTPWSDNIVLCGDSLVKQGLYPELIAAKLQQVNPDVRVVNLAVNGGSQSDAITYLDYLRDVRHTKPRLVVFDFEVSLTGLDTPQNPGTLAKTGGYLSNRFMKVRSGFWRNASFFFSDNFLLVRDRGALKHYLVDFLGVLANQPLREDRSTVELCNANDGSTTYCGMSPDHNLTLDRDLGRRDENIRLKWDGSPVSGRFRFNPNVYDPIITYCQKNEIPLMLVWLPHERYMYQARWYQAPYTESWFRQRFEESARKLFVFPVYLNDCVSGHASFSDYRHLSTYGCIKASEALGDTLAQPKYRSLIEHHVPAAVKPE
jgi:hypothetical protein